MASRGEIGAVYAGGVVQGVVLVAFPAVAAIFTSAAHYGLSNTEYGGMFVPQAITAILASLLGAGLTRKIGGKRVLLLGLAADFISMALLFLSQFATGTHELAFGLLLAATGCLGIGFGFVVPSLNTFTAAFFPDKVDRAILTLNALLGVGTALAPIFATIFVGLGFWWGLPLLMGVLTAGLVLFTLGLPLADSKGAPSDASNAQVPAKMTVPARFWLYAAFALIYGVCETMNGNWATVYLSKTLLASAAVASMALTGFWVAVTGGRVLFAALEKWIPERQIFRALPILMIAAFLTISYVPNAAPGPAILPFALAGLGCSALLPLVISFGQGELVTMRASVAGALIGFYQMGYGLAAFGVGPVEGLFHLSLGAVYGLTSLTAAMLATLALAITARPRPG
jgi:fucose permease